MKALVIDSVVRDVVLDLAASLPVEERYTPDLVAQMVDCGPEVQPGWTYQEGVFAPAGPSLEERKAAAKERIDTEAEARRAALLTPGVGQMATYQSKEIEAKDYLEDPSPHLPSYPFIQAECQGTGQDASTTAQTILARAALWRAYGAAVEGVRLGAKRQITQAQDAAAVQAVLDGLTWPSASAGV